MDKTIKEEDRQLVNLKYLNSILADNDIDSELVPKQNENSLPFLMVSFESPGLGYKTNFQLLYLSTSESFTKTDLLRFYFLFPFMANEKVKETYLLIDYLNRIIPFGVFTLETNGKIFFRYVYALLRFEQPKPRCFIEVLSLFLQIINEQGRIIKLLIENKISLNDIIVN